MSLLAQYTSGSKGGESMSKYCPLADAYTNCTENCKDCLEEEAKKEEVNNENP